MKEEKIAVIHGRFQPFHLGHFRYAELCLDLADEIIIGITNPDPRSQTKIDGDDHRHLDNSNPFTYYERARIIQKTLLDKGIDTKRYMIVPFQIENLEIAKNYVPQNATFYMRDRGSWTETKIQLFEQAGLKPAILDNDELLDISGSEIRSLIKNKGNWRQFVSPSASEEIKLSSFYKSLF